MSLSQLWSKTNGIYIEGRIIYLRVKVDDQPVSYVPNRVWLASYEKLNDESGWRVGIWGDYLKPAFAKGATAEDVEAVEGILRNTQEVTPENLKAGLWIPVPVAGRDEPAANL